MQNLGNPVTIITIMAYTKTNCFLSILYYIQKRTKASDIFLSDVFLPKKKSVEVKCSVFAKGHPELLISAVRDLCNDQIAALAVHDFY